MTREAEALWRELLKRAGPCSSVPTVNLEQCFTSIGIAADAVEPALAELLNIGAIAALSIDELRKLARRERLPGDFVRWDSGAAAQFYRVADPDDLRQAALAESAALRREDADLRQQEELREPSRLARQNWLDMWQGYSETIQQQAETFWRERCANGPVDPSLTPNIGTSYLEERFQSVGSRLIQTLAKLRERRNVIAAELVRLSAIQLPKWSAEASTVGCRRDQIPRSVQHEVWRRDQGRCVECGSREKLEFDHIIPVSRGGATTARNLQLLCEPCNRRKNNRI